MSKKGMGFLSMAILLMALTVAVAVSQNANFDIDNFKENLNWTHKDIEVTSAPDLGNALEHMINGLGDAAFSFCKWVAQFSYDNPTVPWKLLIYLLLISILAPILYYGFMACVIIFLLIKEWYLSKKEKKRIK